MPLEPRRRGGRAAGDGEDGRRVTFTRAGWAALAVFAVLQAGLLVLNVLGIGRQEQLLERQLGLAERSYDAARPAVQDARRLLDDARDRLPQTRRRARDAARLVDRSRPLVEDLAEIDAAAALAAAGDLAVELRQDDRLVSLVERARRLLAAVERAGSVEAIREARGLLHELLSVQRRTLSAQLQALEIQRATLAVQREALRHIRSLDRKTGGELPPP